MMGTFGFMAPEMIVLKNTDTGKPEGYTCAVDFWSLGITMYYLLTSELPFKHANVAKLLPQSDSGDDTSMNTPSADLASGSAPASIESAPQNKTAAPNGETLNSIEHWLLKCRLTGFEFMAETMDYLSIAEDTVNIITRLLHPDGDRRLGAGAHGGRNIKNHRYFKDISFNLLAQKLIKPPAISVPLTNNGTGTLLTFQEILDKCGKSDWSNQVPPNYKQHHFARWDYISNFVLKTEMGIENDIELLRVAKNMPSSILRNETAYAAFVKRCFNS